MPIHNTDIVNWVKGDYPVQAQGMGGRAAVSGPDTGDVFDNFYIEYTYADGGYKIDNIFEGTARELIYLGDHLRTRIHVCGNDEFIVKVPNSAGRIKIKKDGR